MCLQMLTLFIKYDNLRAIAIKKCINLQKLIA